MPKAGNNLSMKSFSLFSQDFRSAVRSPRFGEATNSRQLADSESLSPAANEIALKKCLNALTANRFLRCVYRLIKQQQEREKERERLSARPAIVQKSITKLRNAQKTLATARNTIRRVYSSLPPQDWNVPDELVTAMTCLQSTEDRLLTAEEQLCWLLNPKHRKAHYHRSQWRPVDEIYKIFQPPRSRAADQWLIRTLDEHLKKEFHGDKCLSAITRYRIIAEIFRSAGIGIYEVGTIKQYLLTRRGRRASKKSTTPRKSLP